MTDDSAEDPAAVVGNDRANQHTHGGMQFIYSFCLGNPMKDALLNLSRKSIPFVKRFDFGTKNTAEHAVFLGKSCGVFTLSAISHWSHPGIKTRCCSVKVNRVFFLEESIALVFLLC